jgi:hypothetical protein
VSSSPRDPKLTPVSASTSPSTSADADAGNADAAGKGMSKLALAIFAALVALPVLYLLLRSVRQCAHKKMKPFKAELPLVFVCWLTLVDFVTDCATLASVQSNAEAASLDVDSDKPHNLVMVVRAGFAFLVLPVLVNILLLIRELRSVEMLAFWKFFLRNQISGSL